MSFGNDENSNLIGFKTNEFELAVQTDVGGIYDHLRFLSPATIAAFKNIDSLTEKFEEAKNRKLTEDEWQKMSPEERVVYRMGIDNEDDDQRMKVVLRSQAQGATEFFGHADKLGMETEQSEDFSDVTFDVFEDVLINTVHDNPEMSEQEKKDIEKKKREELDQKLLDDKILALKNEAVLIQERIEALPEQLTAENEELVGDAKLDERRLKFYIEQEKDKLLNEKTVAENKLRRLTMPIEEQEKYEAKLQSERKQYYEYGKQIYKQVGNDPVEAKKAIEIFAEELKNPKPNEKGETPEAVHVDRDFLLEQYKIYCDEPSVKNVEEKLISKTGEINDDYNPDFSNNVGSIIGKAPEGQTAKEMRDIYQDAGGTIVGDKDGNPFKKSQSAPTETKSSFSSPTSTAPSGNTTTQTQQRRVYTESSGINAEDLSSTIERSVAMQKEREKIKMQHREEEAEKAKVVEEPQQQQQQRPQPQVEPEAPKRRGFFSFFRRNKAKPKPKTLAERYTEYYEGETPSVFNKENKPDNYYEFRATAKGMAERGMILGGHGSLPLLPPKEDQMREVSRARGFKRKVRAYVRTHRFRVTVKVAAYCAFTIGLAMIGGEASIENREQYVMAFVSMFGGLLLMNSIREDGIDLPAMPFAQPRKNDGNNRSNGTTGGSFF